MLFLTTVLPAERSTGGEVASQAFVDALRAAGHRVVVVGYRRRGSELEPGDDELSAGCRPIETRGAGLRPLAWLATAVVLRLPYSAAKYRSRRYRQALRKALAELYAELVIVDHAQTAWALPRVGLDVPTVYLAHNVEHDLYREAAARARAPLSWVNRREARRVMELERWLVSGADRVWALSERDAQALGRLAPCPPPLSFALPPPPTEHREEVAKAYDVGILGTWTWAANAAGLRWFVDRVLPLLPCSSTVAIAGAGAGDIVPALPNVTRYGRVPDSRAFLARARVLALPSVAGAGVQVKTLEAIANEQPVVATSVALRGIADPPPTVRVADEPAEFAAVLTELLTAPPAEASSVAAREWARQRRARFRADVANAGGSLAATAPPPGPRSTRRAASRSSAG